MAKPRGRPRGFDRQDALRRAIGVFIAHGYDGATLEDLQDAMGGISPPSFYAAFGSKEQLFREAADLYRATAGSKVNAALDAPRARDAIAGMLRAAAATFCDPDGAGGCLIVLGAINATRGNKEAYEHVRAMRIQTPDIIRARLERAAAEGELSPDLDFAGIASFYATVLHGLAIRARDGASRASMTAAVDGAMAAWKSLTSARASAGPRGKIKRRLPRR